jgi:hypothetical protein
MKTLSPLVLLLLAACSGTDGDTFTRPEVCDDGVDNNGNGLVDCDDASFCGGLQCQAPDTDVDTDEPLPPLEISYTAAECCDFTFTTSECPKSIGTFGMIDRGEDDAVIDVSCDLVNSEAAVQWQVQGGSDAPTPFIVDTPVYAGSSVTIEGFFNCAVPGEFTTHCRANIETDEDRAEIEFDITGTPAM